MSLTHLSHKVLLDRFHPQEIYFLLFVTGLDFGHFLSLLVEMLQLISDGSESTPNSGFGFWKCRGEIIKCAKNLQKN